MQAVSWLLTHLMALAAGLSRGRSRLHNLAGAMALLHSLQAGPRALGSPRCGLGDRLFLPLTLIFHRPAES